MTSSATSTTNNLLAPEHSTPSLHLSLDLLRPASVNSSVLGGQWVRYPPVRLTDGGPLEHNVEAVQDQYTDLGSTYLEVECSVVKENGDSMGANADDVKAWPGDNMAHTIFQKVGLSIAGQGVEYATDYPYRAYVETLLSHGPDVKKGRLAGLSGWWEDGNLAKDSGDFVAAATTARKNKVTGNKARAFCGRMHLSCFAQSRYIAPGVNWRLEMERSDSSFCLMSADAAPAGGARVKITKCDLYVRRVHVNPTLMNAHTESLLNGDRFTYPLTRVKTHLLTMPLGVQNYTLKVDESGQLPQRLIVGFLSHSARSGSYQQSPFNFKNFGVDHVSLIFNGIPVGRAYKPDFTRSLWAREYMHLMESCDRGDVDADIGVPYESFGQGFALYAFDGRPDLTQGEAVPLIRTGSVSIEVGFKAATTETLSALIYAEHYGAFLLDAEQRVSLVGASVL